MQPDDGRQQVFAFAYDRFKVAESDVGGVYSLVGIMLTVQAGLAAGLAATADARLVGQAGHSDTALLYLLLLLSACTLWIISTTYLCRAAVLRQGYQGLARLPVWLERLDQLRRGGASGEVPAAATPEDSLFSELLDKLAVAEQAARELNEQRRRQLHRSSQFSAATLAFTVAAFVVQFSVSAVMFDETGGSVMADNKDDKKVDTSNVIETRSGNDSGTVKK